MAGRPSKYETHVKARFPEIKEWLQAGATEAEIAENLGIHKSVFCKYKKQFKELNDLCKNGRKQAVQEIKAALFKRATGMNYTETKMTEDSEGYWKRETTTKYALPDPTAAMMLLKHWDKDAGWTSDPQSLELKKEEFELKKKHFESEEW